MSLMRGRIGEIDAKVEAIRRLIEGASKEDPEMAAGLATTEPMPGVQSKINEFAGAAEDMDRLGAELGYRG
ncbi:hypothetical protein [Actinoplanes utahensis]|uniref:Uncharacterized protein n=1 Tax=Actinoplanes utahensis TaxID=1869 RepID=A0A0A6UN92_ACTUT|nr:hypothetical protein [Actinoplanes utahensis]KHD76548.1 hypothetical protein MB27_16210 [Actinoplanes utahensis]GIF31227.1 hypothetical protein Aut01nite_42130 [Actinoplanes utahensis]